MTKTSFYQKTGFSLVELAMVVAVIGIVVGASMTVGVSQITKQRISNTHQEMQIIKQHLNDYVARNGRLPCPASMTTAATAAGFGSEAGAAATCAGSGAVAGTWVKTINGKGVRVGAVPIVALGLSKEFMADDWGGRYVYIMDRSLGNTTSCNTAGGTGDMAVLDRNGNTIAEGINFALISHGMDESGAYDADSGTISNACDTAKLAGTNCDYASGADGAAKTLIKAPYNNGDAAAAFFDDYITWGTAVDLSQACNPQSAVMCGSSGTGLTIGNCLGGLAASYSSGTIYGARFVGRSKEPAVGTDWYVSPTGTSVAPACTNSAAPCPLNNATLSHASASGRHIWVLDGVYNITSNLTIPGSRTLEACNPKKAVIDFGATLAQIVINSNSNTLRNLVIQNGGDEAIFINGGNDNNLIGLLVQNNQDAAILVQPSNIYSLPWSNATHATGSTTGNRNIIIDTVAYDNYGGTDSDGIQISGGVDNKILHNTLMYNTDNATDTWVSYRTVLRRNEAFKNGYRPATPTTVYSVQSSGFRIGDEAEAFRPLNCEHVVNDNRAFDNANGRDFDHANNCDSSSEISGGYANNMSKDNSADDVNPGTNTVGFSSGRVRTINEVMDNLPTDLAQGVCSVQ
jgi:prepilin-type N-terminal cleavage/methylation domain-containing protein